MNKPQMVHGWQQRIDDAQHETTVVLAGKTYTRRPYGNDYGPTPPKSTCRDCAVSIGQYHVVGCCVEACARCGAQALGCDCYLPRTSH